MYREEDFSFSYSSRDINDNPLPQSVFQKFQDLAGNSAEELGVGYNTLKEKDLIWVVVKQRYIVLKDVPFENLKSFTWPHPKKSIEYNREYKITDYKGEPLIIGISKWCVCNIKTRKLDLKGVDYIGNEYHQENNFPSLPYINLKPVDTSDLKPSLIHQVVFTELDHNRHMNNTYYASLIIDSIPGMADYKIEDMQINFLSECHLGEELSIYTVKMQSDNEYQVLGVKKDMSLSFNSYLKVKHI